MSNFTSELHRLDRELCQQLDKELHKEPHTERFD